MALNYIRVWEFLSIIMTFCSRNPPLFSRFYLRPSVIPSCPTAPALRAGFPALCSTHIVADCVKGTQTMFLLKVCSSSHSCCWVLASLTNAGLVLGPERIPSLGILGDSHTHTLCTAPVSALHLTPLERHTERGKKEAEKCTKKKKKERERRMEQIRGEHQIRMQVQTKRRAAVKTSAEWCKEAHHH